MGNIITADYKPGTSELLMGNGLTSTFLAVLLLSGSDLARSDNEIATVVWLAEHDQSVVGLGVVGFDVSELGWTPGRFVYHKTFLLDMVDMSASRHRWQVLGYEPNAGRLLTCLSEFRELVFQFPKERCPDTPFGDTWSVDGLRPDHAKCKVHAVYLHSLRMADAECCLLCND